MDFHHLKRRWLEKTKKEKFYLFAGSVFLLLTLIGIIFPIMPQVPFAIISAYFFSQGSPTVHRKIRENRILGGPVKDWEDHRIVRSKLKLTSTLMMIAGAVIAHWQLSLIWALVIDTAFLVSTIFILTRKSS